MLRYAHRFLLVAAIVLLAAYAGLGMYLSQGKVLGPRHAPVIDYPAFDFENGSFTEYQQYVEQYLRTQRTGPSGPDIIANLLPFLLEPPARCPRQPDGTYPRGIVLTHGLIDSPYSMRPFGEALQARCFLVYGLLLPGHGSRPGAMLGSTWQHWAQAQHWASQQLAEQAESVFLGGHSAGATLAIVESARNPRVDGLILFAPALGINPASRYARFISPLGRVFAGAAWFEVDDDEALYRYESFTFASAAQTWALIQQTWQEERATHRNLPTFTVAALPDNTVDTSATVQYMQANTHPASNTLLFAQHPYPSGPGLTVVNSASAQTGVLSLSHLGLMTPPEHPYFGLSGSYRNCEHYGDVPDDSKARCKKGERDYYAEPTAENLASGLIERIAFNPRYEVMLEQLDMFLASLGRL